MRLTAQIRDYEMEQIVLDIGSDVNVLTKKTREMMGKIGLKWPPVQLRMANQVKVIPLGRLSGVSVDLDGVRSVAEFEVIEIVDDSNPYPKLLGIEWALNNQDYSVSSFSLWKICVAITFLQPSVPRFLLPQDFFLPVFQHNFLQQPNLFLTQCFRVT